MTTAAAGSEQAWHAVPAAEAAALLGVDPDRGIAPAEALRRLAEHGRNELGTDEGPGRLALLADQFKDVLIWILAAAAVVSGAFLNEWIDAGVIMAIVVLNAALGYVQEARAEDALARLKELAAPEAVVVRDGEEERVPNAELVPGDVLALEAGDRVGADARLLIAAHLEVDEAALTGESLPVRKTTDPAAVDAKVGDRTGMVFASTTVTGGRGRAVVVGTGRATEMGRIADLLAVEDAPTPLQLELNRVGRRLAVLAIATAAIVFGAGFLRGIEAESMFLIAVALAVAAIPEGLPAVVTIVLSRGVQRMARENSIVRRLPAVEALGSATVVCTDKTGTLTRNEMRVQELVLSGFRVAPGDAEAGDPRVARYLEVAVAANDARKDAAGEYLGDPTEVALLWSAEDAGADPVAIRERLPRQDEVAFDSRRKRMSTLHRVDGGWRLMMKGAPEVVAERCDRLLDVDQVEPLDGRRRSRTLDIAEDLARRGLRTLAFAYRDFDDPPGDVAAAEEQMVLVAVVGISDAVRDEAAESVRQAHDAGIRVVMVTGDHQVTAESVARDVGILREGEEVMPGRELSELSAEQLAARVERYAVYSRVDPVDKVKIVEAWQGRGQIVAMTGDGVNDAPALRAADIGVGMGSGTDVAKEASDMVLADDNFATIVSAVREGRGIFANLKKVVYFLLSANVSEVFLMFIGFMVFGGLGEPLLAVQLLWINLVTDGLPALALGLDPPPAGAMDGPPDEDRNVLSARRQASLVAFGSILGAAALAALIVGHYVFGDPWIEVQSTVFTTLVLVQLAHAFNVHAAEASGWRHGFRGNPTLLWGAIGSLALHLLVIYTSLGQTLFDTTAIGLEEWLLIAALTVASFAVVDVVKRRIGGGLVGVSRPSAR